MPDPASHRPQDSGRHEPATTQPPLRLAVIDNDSSFLQVLRNRAEHRGWEYQTLTGGVPTEDLIAMRLDVLIIDLTALGRDGAGYLARVCRDLPALPVIICSGPSAVAQRIRGLRSGADDWLQKPCHAEELIARIQAVIRRRTHSGARAHLQPITTGEIDIHGDRFQAFAHGLSLDLTRREFQVLDLLASTDGRVLEREEIYQRIWGYAMARGDRSIDVYVRKLRHKLELASPGWHYIHTHFGVGYRFEPVLIGLAPSDHPAAPAEPVPTPSVPGSRR